MCVLSQTIYSCNHEIVRSCVSSVDPSAGENDYITITIPGTHSQNYAPILHKLCESFALFDSPNYPSEECPKCIKLRIDGLAQKLKMDKYQGGVKIQTSCLEGEEGEYGCVRYPNGDVIAICDEPWKFVVSQRRDGAGRKMKRHGEIGWLSTAFWRINESRG